MKNVRPTSGRVLLALFSILGDIEQASFLDLFAGTGRVGIEASRRGASSVVMVEVLKNRARDIECAVLKGATPKGATPKGAVPEGAVPEGAVLKGAVPGVRVLALELRRATEWLVKRGYCFDVIFADPPYHEGWGNALLHVKALTKILKKEGVLVVEHASREALHIVLPWVVTDVRSYGETTLTFLKNGGQENGEPENEEPENRAENINPPASEREEAFS
jgi:16S rRNA G966 N2-methylase RsmD